MRGPPPDPVLRPSAGRVPPHDLQAEAAVLSHLLLHADDYDLVAGVLTPSHFYSDANRHVFEGMGALSAAGELIDIVTVVTWLKDRDRLAQVGGSPYVSQLLDSIPAVANVVAHAEIVRDKWTKRQLIARCQVFAAEAYASEDSGRSLVQRAESNLAELGSDGALAKFELIGPLIATEIDKLAAAQASGITFTGIDTGFRRLNAMTAGLHDGDLVVVAGRPGMGKSAFVTNIAVNVARAHPGRPRYGAAIFSLEMPKEQLALRIACAEERVDAADARANRLTPAQWALMTQAAVDLARMPLWIDDTSSISILELRARVKKLQRDIAAGRGEQECDRLGLVAVDYMQLMQGMRQYGDSREREVSLLSAGLKQLAKDLSVPVMALSQLNRSPDKGAGGDKRPKLSDLRECVVGETLVTVVGDDGESEMQVHIDDLVGTEPMVRAYAERAAASCWVAARSDKVWCVGRRDVFKVVLDNGMSLTGTAEHRVMTACGWERVSDLSPDDLVCVYDRHARDRNTILTARVRRIVPAGQRLVYDMTVPGPASWIANGGIVSHNSGAIEQDADSVWFVYREDYYDKQATRGEAELILGKQRNGATGTVELQFDGPSMRFFERASETDAAFDGEFDDALAGV